MSTKGAILCGGEGRRLRPLTNYFQKTMIPVGPHRRPLLEYIVRLLIHHRVGDITLLTGYRSEEIENYFGDGSRFGGSINYARDAEGAYGSAVAVENAIESGKLSGFDELLVYYGDVLSDLNISDLLGRHRSERAAVTLVISDRYTLPVGVAEVSGGIVKSFNEKPTMRLNVTTGCMVIGRDALPLLESSSRGNHRDLMTHFIPSVLKSGLRVSPYYVNGFWYDIGTTEAYERLDNKTIESRLRFLG